MVCCSLFKLFSLVLAQIWRWKEMIGSWLSFHNDTKPLVRFEDMSTIFTSHSNSILWGCSWVRNCHCQRTREQLKWLIDCLSVHKFEKFFLWMKEEYSHIFVLFVSTNCMSRLQLANVILWLPLKCGFANCFKWWSPTSSIWEQVKNKDSHIHLDLQINILLVELCSWLLETWKCLGSCK
jgi:hypothetical protein